MPARIDGAAQPAAPCSAAVCLDPDLAPRFRALAELWALEEAERCPDCGEFADDGCVCQVQP